ncbi:MAG: C4-dicarboxylate TRAP transporter substrate-binding protein [Hyphomicrobiales bacterium]|nr:C4-dicarboxylate TRAP transporter substrate-binding protein [Hyphomicrobiales bacterium]
MQHRGLRLAALVFAAAAFAAPASAATKLIYANYLSPKHSTTPELVKYFEAVEKDTNGSIDWEWHFASSLLGIKDIPSGVRDGIADGGYFVGALVPSEMPVDAYLTDFSLMNDDAVAMTGVINELVLLRCPECDDEYRNRFNVQFLGSYAPTDYVFQCKEEFRTMADFKGQKIRAFGGWSDLIKAMGGIPVSIPANEMYEAMSRGIIACAPHSITNQKTRSMGEVAHYIILNSVGGYFGGSLINLRTEKWDKLTPQERTVMLKHLPALVAASAFNYVRMDETVRKEMEAKGNKFYDADPALGKFIKEFRASYIKDSTPKKGHERGVKDPEGIAKTVNELRAKWDGLLKQHGRDQATFEKLLWDEVYSKVPVK